MAIDKLYVDDKLYRRCQETSVTNNSENQGHPGNFQKNAWNVDGLKAHLLYFIDFIQPYIT